MDNQFITLGKRTIPSLMVVAACGLFLTGCQFDRLNHFNSPENAAASTKNLGAISVLHDTNQAGILSAIGSDTTFIQINDKTHELINESTFIDAMGNKSWLSLRAGMWCDFGVMKAEQQKLYDAVHFPDQYTDQLKADADIYDGRVTTNISNRVNKIETIGKVLQTLADGQAALAKNAAKQTANSLAQLQKLTNNSSAITVPNLAIGGTNQISVADLLRYLDNAVVMAGSQMATNDVIRTNATNLQKMILTQIAESRDPATVYALVATIGSGLGTNDLALLDAFLSTLQASLSNQISKVYVTGTQPESGTFGIDSNNGAVPPGTPPGEKTDRRQTSENSVGQFIISTFNASDATGGRTLNVSSAIPAVTPLGGEASRSSYEDKFIKSYKQVFGLLVQLPDSSLAKVKSLAGKSPPPETAIVSLEEILTNLPVGIGNLSQAAQELHINVTAIQDILNSSNTIHTFTTAFSGSDKTGTNILNAVLNAAVLDPTLAKYFNQALPYTNLLAEVAGIAHDIASEEMAAGARLLSFFSELSQNQVSLYQENSRHYTMLGAVGSREIQRWNWIGHVYHRNSELYRGVPLPNDWTKILEPGIPLTVSPKLFLDSSLINSFATFYASQVGKLHQDQRGYTNKWDVGAVFPVVNVTDRILPSLQLLSETAKKLRASAPSTDDPIGMRKEVALDRLNQAIELLLNSSFVINYNVRQADDLNRLLYNEIAEHDVILDGIASQTQLAGIRLQAGDSAAFHNSGITDKDFQAVLSALETAAVGYISIK